MEFAFLLILVSIAGPALASSSSHQQLTVDSNQLIVAYLTQSVNDAQFYRKEVQRQLDLLTRFAETMREQPTSERFSLAAGLINHLASTYEQLDQSLDAFLPDEMDLSKLNEIITVDDDADDEHHSADKFAKRFVWPKRMYSAAAKYNKIPVIRTG